MGGKLPQAIPVAISTIRLYLNYCSSLGNIFLVEGAREGKRKRRCKEKEQERERESKREADRERDKERERAGI